MESCHVAIAGYPYIKDYLCDSCKTHYETVKKVLKDNEVNFLHDDNLVRGLDYYTNTAFEIHIPDIGGQSAIGGGGRYNGLVKACGGPDVPGVGFALGLERILLALTKEKEVLADNSYADVFVIAVGEELEDMSTKLVSKLRKNNIKSDKDYAGRSLKAQMKFANRLGAKIAIIIGEDEINNNYFTVRNMNKGEQSQVANDNIIEHINNILANS